MSSIKVDIPILPLEVPDSVKIMSDVFNPSCSGTFTSIPLDRLSYENLDSICNEFRKNVFEKANIKDKKPVVNRKIDIRQLEFGGQSGCGRDYNEDQ